MLVTLSTNVFVVLLHKKEPWKLGYFMHISKKSIIKSWKGTKREFGQFKDKLSNSWLSPITMCIHTVPEKYKRCEKAFIGQQSYISKYLPGNLTQDWPKPLTDYPLAWYHRECASRSSCSHTVLQGNQQACTVNYSNSQRNYIHSLCLVRRISLLLSRKGMLMVFLLTCDLLTAIRI